VGRRKGAATELEKGRNPRAQAARKNERKVMNDKFDELAKALAQSVTRRAALKRFGAGLAAFALAALGLADAEGAPQGKRGRGEPCSNTNQCQEGLTCMYPPLQPPGPLPKHASKICW